MATPLERTGRTFGLNTARRAKLKRTPRVSLPIQPQQRLTNLRNQVGAVKRNIK